MKRLIEATQFSMAHQDVRYYLNGMLFETEGEELRTVADRRPPSGSLFNANWSIFAKPFGDRAA